MVGADEQNPSDKDTDSTDTTLKTDSFVKLMLQVQNKTNIFCLPNRKSYAKTFKLFVLISSLPLFITLSSNFIVKFQCFACHKTETFRKAKSLEIFRTSLSNKFLCRTRCHAVTLSLSRCCHAVPWPMRTILNNQQNTKFTAQGRLPSMPRWLRTDSKWRRQP